MRMRASQDLAVEHAGQLHVEGVGCPAGHLRDSVHIVNVVLILNGSCVLMTEYLFMIYSSL